MSKIVNFQSRLRRRVPEQAQFNDRMDTTRTLLPVLARAIADMRALGADSKTIANTFRVAVEELDKA